MATTSASMRLISSSTLISQGAEAKVYKGYLTPSGSAVLLKYRFKKTYRHPSLDTTLTKARVAGEARALLKCLRSGVNVPGIRMVDASEGLLGIEWIEGKSVKYLLPSGADDGDGEGEVPVESPSQTLEHFGISVDTLMNLIGIEIAKMHLADIIHGDLTTSNMMVRDPASFTSLDPKVPTELVLIDFGLSYHSTLVEDKAVDLYVLERAFASTHPDSEPMFAGMLAAYEKQVGKEWSALRRRLDEVRLRGRKRSMVG
ncbi:kinase-like protein [Pholiota conissans]|uniref:EKC/KEOPS complex subunit BUD32 n=1 Tax=Pholiota conissans TaxID=109636 RepID=A0A9P5ZCI3_9AGAR|nr:kinase-like protein [Pholiota conissans]